MGDRVRKDFGDVDDLAQSISDLGLVQPIVVTYDHHLVAGERRLRAHKQLGKTTIKAVYIEVLDEAHKVMLEATENIVRKDFTWQEHVLAIDRVHQFKSTEMALKSEAWGIRETSRLLNSPKSNVHRALFLAEYLKANDPEILKAESPADAFRVLCKRREDELSKLLVKETTGPVKGKADISDEEFFTPTGTTGFVPGIGTPLDVDERPGGKLEGITGPVVVPLSNMFRRGDSLEIIKTFAEATFDAVISDWPYGIDMENLGEKQVESVRAEHGVDTNRELHKAILPEIFRVLKPNTFFITWTDQEVWEWDYQLAVAAGFKVQPWPLTWHKTSICKNSCAQYNFTKNTEIAMVCRKGNATLIRPQSSSVWSGGNESEERLLGHPFSKPFGLWEWLYGATCLRGAVVYDPFVGSGSSTIPAIRLGLRPMGSESNEAHYNRLIVNVQNYYKSLDPTCEFK